MNESREGKNTDRLTTLEWYERSYATQGLQAQRRYPNEELIRFLAKNFFGLPHKERARVSILDVGCGSCSNLWMLAREGFDAHGIDVSAEALRLGRQVLAEWNVNAQLQVGDLLSLPYENDRFNAIVDVFASYVLNISDFNHYLAEVARVLKPSGRFFLFTPTDDSDAFKNHVPARKIDEFTLSGIYRKDSPYYGNFYPFRFSDIASLREKLRGAGLEPESIELLTRTHNQMAENFQFVSLDARRGR